MNAKNSTVKRTMRMRVLVLHAMLCWAAAFHVPHTTGLRASGNWATRIRPPVLLEPNMIEIARTRERMLLLVRDLRSIGASKEQVQAAFVAALGEVYPEEAPPASAAASPSAASPSEAPESSSANSSPTGAAQLVAPATASDAQKAFRAAFSGQLVTSETQKFLNIILVRQPDSNAGPLG